MQIKNLQRRLASTMLKCGKRKVWIDPNEINEISIADNRKTIKKLIKEGIIVKKNSKAHSKNRKKLYQEAKQKGKHKGIGSRKGSSNARSSQGYKWHFKQKVFRNLLRKYRNSEKIDKHLYRELYLKSKGNVFKNKRVLLDYIHSAKIDHDRKRLKEELQTARHTKKKNVRINRIINFNSKMENIYKEN